MSKYDSDRPTPFNDATEQKQKTEGYPSGGGGRMPLLIKLIGYFIFGGIFLMLIITVCAAVFLE
ncbi:hypothetical protein [Halobacillus naozhouensis]|uniref:Uncharacterized protein n=1 Tax=Halobacillus naozhouensis TaxID=554880 RepID=A0ABY8J485_9BACI|nr:hypothetical protein [Halobacillus naozhouensis]WFT76414.1 hypothetical protein P9989_08645 [Halobacillus naozhouensis]